MNLIFKTLALGLLCTVALPYFTHAQNMDWLMVAQSYAEHDGSNYVLQDSTIIERNTEGHELLRTTLRYDNVTDEWTPYDKREFTVDAAGRPLQIELSIYVTATQTYVPSSRTNFTYDANGNTLTYTSSSWQGGTNTWRATYRTISTYSADNLLLNNITQSYDMSLDSLVNGARYENTYNANNKLIKRLDQVWVSGVWQDQRETNYTINANGDVTVMQENMWVAASSEWRNLNRHTNTYNAEGRRTIQLREVWNIGANDWKNQIRYNDTYDANGRKFEDRKYNWDEVAQDWQIEYLFTTTYGATSQILITQRWNNGAQALVNDSRIEYGQTVNNQRVDVFETWSATDNNWRGNRTQTTMYEPAYDGKQVSYEIRRWNGTEYAGDELTKYYYNQFEVSSIDGIEHLASVSVFPNPFAEKVNFSISPTKAAKVSIKIFNLQGQLVGSVANGENIDSPSNFIWVADNYGAGIYLYQLTIDGTSTSGQLMLSK